VQADRDRTSYLELLKDKTFIHIITMNFRKLIILSCTAPLTFGSVNKMCFFASLALMVRCPKVLSLKPSRAVDTYQLPSVVSVCLSVLFCLFTFRTHALQVEILGRVMAVTQLVTVPTLMLVFPRLWNVLPNRSVVMLGAFGWVLLAVFFPLASYTARAVEMGSLPHWCLYPVLGMWVIGRPMGLLWWP
jgi:hypothetical protein